MKKVIIVGIFALLFGLANPLSAQNLFKLFNSGGTGNKSAAKGPDQFPPVGSYPYEPESRHNVPGKVGKDPRGFPSCDGNAECIRKTNLYRLQEIEAKCAALSEPVIDGTEVCDQKFKKQLMNVHGLQLDARITSRVESLKQDAARESREEAQRQKEKEEEARKIEAAKEIGPKSPTFDPNGHRAVKDGKNYIGGWLITEKATKETEVVCNLEVTKCKLITTYADAQKIRGPEWDCGSHRDKSLTVASNNWCKQVVKLQRYWEREEEEERARRARSGGR